MASKISDYYRKMIDNDLDKFQRAGKIYVVVSKIYA